MPTAAPTTKPPIITGHCTTPCANVAINAMTMPAIERRLPKRAVFGELMYFRPRMNRIPVIRYATLSQVAYCETASTLVVLLSDDRARPEHREHPLRHGVSAENVERRQHDQDKADHWTERGESQAGDEDRADEYDAVDGGCGRHQRGMQGARYAPDYFDADEHREDEDRELGEQMVGHAVPFASSASSVGLCTIVPLCTSVVPAMISSDMSKMIAASLMKYSSSVWTFLEYSWLASAG